MLGGRRSLRTHSGFWAFSPYRARAARSPSQLDRELIAQNVMVEDLRKKMGGLPQKGHELLEAIAKLREKLELEVRLLNRLEELQKAWKEMSDLQGNVASAQSEVSSLREHIDKECAEKLVLKHEVHVLKNNLKNQDKDVEELRAKGARQSDCFDEL